MEQSRASIEYLQERKILLLNTLSFLHSHIHEVTATTSTLINVLNLSATPFGQLLNLLAMFCGGYKVEPWMTDHISEANIYFMFAVLL
jgi:hypothetical protein